VTEAGAAPEPAPLGPDPAPWRTAAAQVLVDDLNRPVLDGDDHHHLSRVLRLRAGDEVCATDGRGGWRSCAFTGADELDPLDERRQQDAPPYELTVGFALVKGERPELVVQKLTELGVDRIVPFAARRSVVRWDEAKAAKQLERLRRVAREACGQCRRLWVPAVGLADGTGLADLAQLRAGGAVLADAGGRPLRRSDRTVLIGPEGGWDDTESAGADRVGIGEHVLRAETAAIAVGVAVTALRVGLLAEVLRNSP
jgi:16S rRNA (uracil1498-N3)-methyltransferase